MTDITELAQSLKAAAEKATPGPWERGDGRHGGELLVYCDDALGSAVCEATSEYNAIPKYQRIHNLDFIALASPANVLALVEALEKAQTEIIVLQQKAEIDPRTHEIIDLKERIIETNDVLCSLLPDCRYMDPPDGGSVTPLEQVSRMIADYRQRIAELESCTVTAAAADVLAERQRQVTAEGWTAEGDDSYQNSELADAAACYAIHAHNQGFSTPAHWPWPPTWWKQTNPRRDLVKAGALILAEIERLDRAAGIKREAE
ncbi:ead/Ea22-like family protein [Raoultella ornithinolytica]